MGHKEFHLRKISRKARKVQRERPGELEGVGIWEMGVGVASTEFPVGSQPPSLLPPFSPTVSQLIRAAEG